MYWLGPFLAFLIHCESGGGVLGKMYLQFWFCVAIKIILFVTFLLFPPLLPLYVGQLVQVFFLFFLSGGIFPHSTPCPVIASPSYYLLFHETSSSLSSLFLSSLFCRWPSCVDASVQTCCCSYIYQWYEEKSSPTAAAQLTFFFVNCQNFDDKSSPYVKKCVLV